VARCADWGGGGGGPFPVSATGWRSRHCCIAWAIRHEGLWAGPERVLTWPGKIRIPTESNVEEMVFTKPRSIPEDGQLFTLYSPCSASRYLKGHCGGPGRKQGGNAPLRYRERPPYRKNNLPKYAGCRCLDPRLRTGARMKKNELPRRGAHLCKIGNIGHGGSRKTPGNSRWTIKIEKEIARMDTPSFLATPRCRRKKHCKAALRVQRSRGQTRQKAATKLRPRVQGNMGWKARKPPIGCASAAPTNAKMRNGV